MIKDAEKTIGSLTDRQSIAYIGSMGEDGFPNIKAMLAPRLREGIAAYYFTTNTSSVHVSQFRKNPKACIYFCDRRFYRGVMLQGTMEILEDQETKEKLWQEGDTMYYPKGVPDPDYCVLCFRAMTGRYYNHFKSENFTVQGK